MIKDRVLLVDAMNLFARHYAAHPAMSENGQQIGGLVGFFNNLVRLADRCKPEKIYVIWEGGGSKRKRDLYNNYKKASRPQRLNRYYDHIPDSYQNRNYQIKSLIKLIDLVPIHQVYVEDCEADDVIGYLCKYKLSQKNKIIISSDHDYYQLIGKDVLIWSPTLKNFVNTKKVIERYGIHPNNFCLAKSIVGDNSDNIPGVNRVGFKTLSKRYPALSKSTQCSIQEIMALSKTMIEEGSAIKSIKEIYNSRNLIERNYKLVLLDMNNLAHCQIKKINESVENFNLSWKNIEVHRFLQNEGIKSIDVISCNHIFRQLRSVSVD